MSLEGGRIRPPIVAVVAEGLVVAEQQRIRHRTQHGVPPGRVSELCTSLLDWSLPGCFVKTRAA